MRRVLIASDLSEGSRFAVGRGIRLAARHGAAIRIICSIGDGEEGKNSVQDRLHHLARETADDLGYPELEITARVSGLDPEPAILEEADRFDADLIVLGAHGEPKVRDAIFGTTATHLVRNSRRPVLVARNDDMADYARVVAAIDDVVSGETVLRLALDVAPESEIFAVHAFNPTARQILAGDDVLEEVLTGQQLALDRLVSKLAPPAQGRRTSAKAHSVVEKGDVMSVIEESCAELRPDLMVMGTHGRTGISRIVQGSFADDMLLWCASDILVMRANPPEGSR